MGGKVPRSCYLVNKTLEPKEKMQILSVRANSGGQKKLKFKVQVPNSTLRFSFDIKILIFRMFNWILFLKKVRVYDGRWRYCLPHLPPMPPRGRGG